MSENLNQLEEYILKINNNHIFQKLKEYYNQKTIFNALGIERNENRHSAFLCWLLDPKSDHQFGTVPLKKFLALYTSYYYNWMIDDSLRVAFISERYEIEKVQIEKEVPLERFRNDTEIISKLGGKNNRRLDIVVNFSVVLPKSNNDDEVHECILVIENKIYSKESKTGNQYQTEIYHRLLLEGCNNAKLFEVFLNPTEMDAVCPSFLHLTYQQILDRILIPLSTMVMSEHTRIFINDYIRNLGKTARNDKDKEYSILATSAYLKDMLQKLVNIEGMKTIIESAIVAIYGERAKSIVVKRVMKQKITSFQTALLKGFWDENIDILKAAIKHTNVFPDSKDGNIKKIIFGNPKKKIKYFVMCFDTDKNQWIKVAESIYRNQTICIFFYQWMQIYGWNHCLDEIRKVFPLSINKQYEKSKDKFFNTEDEYKTLIFECEKDSTSDYYIINRKGEKIKLTEDKDNWYSIDNKMGWGNTMEGKIAIMPKKKWNEEDFQGFLKYIEANQHLFCRLKIESLEY